MAKLPRAVHGELYPVVTCRQCGHVMRIELPEDESQPFGAVCPKCKAANVYQQSDIQTGQNHRLQ